MKPTPPPPDPAEFQCCECGNDRGPWWGFDVNVPKENRGEQFCKECKPSGTLPVAKQAASESGEDASVNHPYPADNNSPDDMFKR